MTFRITTLNTTIEICDTEHNYAERNVTWCLSQYDLLSVEIKSTELSAVMLGVIILSVVALQKTPCSKGT